MNRHGLVLLAFTPPSSTRHRHKPNVLFANLHPFILEHRVHVGAANPPPHHPCSHDGWRPIESDHSILESPRGTFSGSIHERGQVREGDPSQRNKKGRCEYRDVHKTDPRRAADPGVWRQFDSPGAALTRRTGAVRACGPKILRNHVVAGGRDRGGYACPGRAHLVLTGVPPLGHQYRTQTQGRYSHFEDLLCWWELLASSRGARLRAARTNIDNNTGLLRTYSHIITYHTLP